MLTVLKPLYPELKDTDVSKAWLAIDQVSPLVLRFDKNGNLKDQSFTINYTTNLLAKMAGKPDGSITCNVAQDGTNIVCTPKA